MNKVASTCLGCSGLEHNPHTNKRCTQHNLHDTFAFINKQSTTYATNMMHECKNGKWIGATAAPHNLIQ